MDLVFPIPELVVPSPQLLDDIDRAIRHRDALHLFHQIELHVRAVHRFRYSAIKAMTTKPQQKSNPYLEAIYSSFPQKKR